jgi:hypothetical protein
MPLSSKFAVKFKEVRRQAFGTFFPCSLEPKTIKLNSGLKAQIKNFKTFSQALVAHTCNPS